jgi:hypothetical protein
MSGKYIINPLEPKCWDDGSDPRRYGRAGRPSARPPSSGSTSPSSRTFSGAYKDFDDAHIDTIEMMLGKLYAKWGISDRTNFKADARRTIPSSPTSMT